LKVHPSITRKLTAEREEVGDKKKKDRKEQLTNRHLKRKRKSHDRNHSLGRGTGEGEENYEPRSR